MDEIDIATLHAAEFWDERYGGRHAGGHPGHAHVWSGEPNQRLVEQVSDLDAGDALELGCGEGGDAMWLARQGWRVTATDVSAVAVERAQRTAAERLTVDEGARISWQARDVRTWRPPVGAFDLVTCCYIHLTVPLLRDVQARLADSTRTGGSWLIVNHDPLDLQTTMNRPNIPGVMLSAAEIVGTLDATLWQVEVAEPFPRPFTDPDGRAVTIHDTVVRVVRR